MNGMVRKSVVLLLFAWGAWWLFGENRATAIILLSAGVYGLATAFVEIKRKW